MGERSGADVLSGGRERVAGGGARHMHGYAMCAAAAMRYYSTREMPSVVTVNVGGVLLVKTSSSGSTPCEP